MTMTAFPVIDLKATGENIQRLRKSRGFSVSDLQAYFGFEQPQAIYKWQKGLSLPKVDHLYALGLLFGVPMEEILVSSQRKLHMATTKGQQASACCPYPIDRSYSTLKYTSAPTMMVAPKAPESTNTLVLVLPMLLPCVGTRLALRKAVTTGL